MGKELCISHKSEISTFVFLSKLLIQINTKGDRQAKKSILDQGKNPYQIYLNILMGYLMETLPQKSFSRYNTVA